MICRQATLGLFIFILFVSSAFRSFAQDSLSSSQVEIKNVGLFWIHSRRGLFPVVGLGCLHFSR